MLDRCSALSIHLHYAKKELLEALTDAGVSGFSMSDDKIDLEDAVANIEPQVNRQKGI